MNLNKLIEKLKTTDNNLILMVGIPLCGKSTLVEQIKDYVDDVISRDDIVLEHGNGLSYSDAFHQVNQKDVSRDLRKRILEVSMKNGNVIIDMMNHKRKSRKSHLKCFPNHTKIALVLDCPPKKILLERNDSRFNKEGKFIPVNVIDDLLKSYTSPTKDEGFDYIIYHK